MGGVDLVHGFITLTDTKNGNGRDIPIDGTLRETLNRLPRCFVEKDGQKELVPYVLHDPITLMRYKGLNEVFTRH